MTDQKQLQERDPATGRITKSSPDAAARARAGKAEKARERREQAAKAIREGVASAGVQIPDVAKADAYEVVEHLAEQHTLNAADPSARGSTSSLKTLLQHGWPRPEHADDVGGQTQGGARLDISKETLLALADRMGLLPSGDVVTVEAEQVAPLGRGSPVPFT